MRPLLVLALVAGAAHADSYTAVALDRVAFDAAWKKLSATYEDPGGLVARGDIPELALKSGDFVRAVNGAPAISGSATVTHSLVYFDVLRGKQTVVVRVSIKPASRQVTMARESYAEQIERYGQHSLIQLTKNNAASGVVLPEVWHEVGDAGDVIRAIDGTPTNTLEAVKLALEQAKAHDKVLIKLERAGELCATTIKLFDEPKIDVSAAIKKTSDTSYEIKRDALDMLLANPMPAAKGARVVPAVKDGKPAGFKLFAIRPDSIYAALGLQNGDALRSINGLDLSTADKALEVYKQLRGAKQITAVLERRGQTITLTYTIISGK